MPWVFKTEAMMASSNRVGEDLDRDDEPTAVRIGRVIDQWVRDDGPDWALLEWLQGYGLPSPSGDEEPYSWMTEGLKALNLLEVPSTGFCSRIARFLDQEPDRTRPGRRPQQVLYNLFMLCACLHCSECLAGPLKRLYARRLIRGRWQSFDLRDALLAALIENQDDHDLLPDWMTMIRAGRHDYLPGDAFDGFAGVTKMILPRAGINQPDWAPISDALAGIVHAINREKDRVSDFDAFLSGMFEYFDKRTSHWHRRLLEQLDFEGWPAWARGVFHASIKDNILFAGKTNQPALKRPDVLLVSKPIKDKVPVAVC